MKRALILYQGWNSRGRRDGDEFKREALAFAKFHGMDFCDASIDASDIVALPKRRPWYIVKDACDKRKAETMLTPGECILKPRFNTVVYFGHGTRLRLPSMGVWAPGALAKQLAKCCTDDVTVILYACSAARGFGFADRLRRIMIRRYGMTGCRVLSHTTAGHTTRNPHVEDCGIGGNWRGEYLVPQGRYGTTERWYWWRWVEALQFDPNFRFRYPFMDREEIIEALGK